MREVIPMQLEIKQELPEILGNADYQELKEKLERIGEIIIESGIEEEMMSYAIFAAEEIGRKEAESRGEKYKGLSYKEQERLQETSLKALRCVIGRKLTGESYRVYSAHLADSSLLQRFCLLNRIGAIKVPGKSTLQRYEEMFPAEVLGEVICKLNMKASEECEAESDHVLGLKEAVSLSDYYADSTCVVGNIHFPVDWVLLRDAVRTLMLSVDWIRGKGIKNRMESPKEFIKATKWGSQELC